MSSPKVSILMGAYNRAHFLEAALAALQAEGRPVLVNYTAESEGVTPDQLIERLLEITPAKEDELSRDARLQKIFAS